MTIKRLSMLSLVGLLTVGPLVSNAHAEDLPKPADADLLGKKTVSVLPVFATGPSRKAVFLEAASTALVGTNKAPMMPNEVTTLAGSTGFGFAGASTEADVVLMQVGFLVGSLPLHLSDAKAFAGTVDTLGQARELLAPLAPSVVAAYDRFLTTARANDVDIQALAELFEAAEGGIAAGPQRGHGYLAGGLWFGLAMVAGTHHTTNPAFTAIAGPLAVLFEEDAEFDGSDKKLAASLREVASLLKAEKLDNQAFAVAMGKVFAIEADTRTP